MAATRNHSLFVFLFILAALLPAWGNSGFAAIRFDVIGSPSEVINTGRSEVLGSINLFAVGSGDVTGTSSGNANLIALVFSRPALPIDNTGTTGIRVYSSPGFAAAVPTLVGVENRQIGGQCVGYLTLSLLPGATPMPGDFIRIEGIRGRIDASAAILPGTDLFVDLQPINDPFAISFTRDRIRVAKSFDGLTTRVISDPAGYHIVLSENFPRAFVDQDANNDGVSQNDRVDSSGNALGAPTNSTRLILRLEGIPEGVSAVDWPALSTMFPGTGAVLRLLSSTFSQGTSIATYSFEADDQAGGSDLAVESFTVTPDFVLSTCGAGAIVATATLGPAVPSFSGCAAPLENAARPRFLESYQPLVDRLDPASAVVGSPSFLLKIHGAGFVPGCNVQWDGSDLQTAFINGWQLEVVVPAEELALIGAAALTVSGPPQSGGGISNSAAFQIAPHPLALYFPRLASAELAGSEFTGLALVNLSATTADVTLTAYDTHGSRISGNGITNPAMLTLSPWQQLPLVDTQIFGSGLSSAGTAGWIRLEGNNPNVSGFFLTFDRAVSRLDGTDVSGTALSSFVLPDAGIDTLVHLANPNAHRAAVDLRLMKADGTVRASEIKFIEPMGIMSGNVGAIFPGISSQAGDYIRAESSVLLAPHERIGPSSGDIAALNGQDANAENMTLYSPQYVVGGPDMRSELSVINLDSHPGNVRFHFIADDGSRIGSSRELPIEGQGKILITAQDFFMNAGATMRQGSVEIMGIGVRLSGSVMFGSATPGNLLTALPLAPARRARMLFGQIASDDMYYTGLAIHNPGSASTRTYIQVFDSHGNELAGRLQDVPPGGRVSKMLTDYFPQFAGQKIVGGYITVETIGPVCAFAVFGTKNLTALAAVPSQIR